jgi:hypothetical protein
VEYFFAQDWTTQISLNRLTKLDFKRTRISAMQGAGRPQNLHELRGVGQISLAGAVRERTGQGASFIKALKIPARPPQKDRDLCFLFWSARYD